jgi:multimeric flavodoxin WrbA
MKVLIATSSPNKEGLTAACGEAARQGVVDSGSRARPINLNEHRILRCAVCEDGWGPCRTKHQCRLEDDFAELQRMFDEAEGFAWVTPVYFGQPSEPMKAFFDRLRRCEATKAEGLKSVVDGKPVVCVAAAGGSGNGAIRCLAEMERLVGQLHGVSFDFISVTQKTREYETETIHDALAAMCRPKAAESTMPISARKGQSRARKPRRRIRRRRPSESE